MRAKPPQPSGRLSGDGEADEQPGESERGAENDKRGGGREHIQWMATTGQELRGEEWREGEEEEIAAVRLATDFLPLWDGHFVDRPRGRRRVGSIGFRQFIRCGRGEARGVVRREGGE